MRYRELAEAPLQQKFSKPLIRIVGKNFGDTFFHGTAKKNIRSIAAPQRPDTSLKKKTHIMLPAEMNEFGAAILLAEPRQPQQAHVFAQGHGNALAVVRMRHGTKVLDLSDEVARAPSWTMGNEPSVLRFFTRPAITDDLIEWHLGHISPGYKERNPDWQKRIRQLLDPASSEFSIDEWRRLLVPYARDRGYGAIRLADEVLVTDRAVLLDARLSNDSERHAAASTRTYPGSNTASLFTDQPTGAHDEAGPDEE